jgi:hypothetical protein
MKGVAVMFDTNFEEGWRSDMDIILIATWDGKKPIVYTDISMSEKSLNCEMRDLASFDWSSLTDLVGHNLHGEFRKGAFDLLREVKKVSAPVLQNEGKRFDLYDLARWNGVRTLPIEIISRLRKTMSWVKGQHIKVARWAIEDARLSHDLFIKVRKERRVRFLDTKTGKKAYADVSWHTTEEE